MAQETKLIDNKIVDNQLSAKNVATTVTASGLATLLELTDVRSLVRLFFQVTAGNQNFDAFEVQVKLHPDAGYVTMFSVAADFTTPAGLLVDASGDLTTLATTATGWFIMDLRGLYGLRVQASCASSNSTATVYVSAA